MNDLPAPTSSALRRDGTPAEVFLAFLRLGLTSFGGPIAHIGYYRTELVERRKWLSEDAFADIVALCQFLPGPASSQTGFAIGLMRAGPLGALAAWVAFTLPSALLLVLFAASAAALDNPVGNAVIHGLKIVAVAVVAQAVWGMARTLAPDRRRAGIALAAALVALLAHGATGQIGAIGIGAAAGYFLCRNHGQKPEAAHFAPSLSRRAGAVLLVLFLVLLIALPVLAAIHPARDLDLFDGFYRAGALVFGGGHVVLPLLETVTVAPGLVTRDAFLAGYGAAQAIPGPLFAFAAYLGAIAGEGSWFSASLALIAIFLPGLLLVAGTLPFWQALRIHDAARAAMHGTNAAVVGILGAALYDPLWTSAILAPVHFALALTGFVLLTVWRAPPVLVVALIAGASAALALF